MLQQIFEGEERASDKRLGPIKKNASGIRAKDVVRIQVHMTDRVRDVQPFESRQSVDYGVAQGRQIRGWGKFLAAEAGCDLARFHAIEESRHQRKKPS